MLPQLSELNVVHENKITKFIISGTMNGVDMDDGVPDMTVISDIDEHGINKNLQKRYKKNKIYVSISKTLQKIEE